MWLVWKYKASALNPQEPGCACEWCRAGLYGCSHGESALLLCGVVCLGLDSVPGSWSGWHRFLLTQAEMRAADESTWIRWGHTHEPCPPLLGVFASEMSSVRNGLLHLLHSSLLLTQPLQNTSVNSFNKPFVDLGSQSWIALLALIGDSQQWPVCISGLYWSTIAGGLGRFHRPYFGFVYGRAACSI